MSKKRFIIVSFWVILLLPSITLAANCAAVPADKWFGCIINNIVDYIVWPLFVGLVVIMVIWAGILFLTARGDPNKIDAARRALIWAVVGIIIGLIAFSAVTIIKATLGIQ